MSITKVKCFKSIKISNPKGDLLKLINKQSETYSSFGEIYLTSIKFDAVKAWKMHKKMNSNIFLLEGEVKFVVAIYKIKKVLFKEFYLSKKEYNHIFIPSNTFFGFKGLEKSKSTLLNFASIVHSDREVINKNKTYFDYKW